MLRKLMKYEFKALFRDLAPLYLAWFAGTLIIGIVSRFNVNVNMALQTIGILIYSGLSVAAFVMTLVIILDRRFAKNVYGEEGYFLMSIPATISQHIWSKVISSTSWLILAGVFSTATTIISATIDSDIEIFSTSSFDRNNVKLALEGKAHLIILAIIFVILFVVVSCAVLMLEFYAAISVGQQFTKFKSLITAVTFIICIIFDLYYFKYAATILKDFNFHIGSDGNTAKDFLFSTVFILLMALRGVPYYFINHFLMKNRLNLE